MTSYPFIEELFRAVLGKSKAIEGRFAVSKLAGQEINSDILAKEIQDLFTQPVGKKYPLAIMLPPRSQGNYVDGSMEWEKYHTQIFFLTPSNYTGTNQVLNPNIATGTSTHTVPQTWHDMKRSGIGFLRVLRQLEKLHQLPKDKFRLASTERMFTPVTEVGTDMACGVSLQFAFSVMIGCTLEDYNSSDIAGITIPALDSHPEHQL